MYHTSNGRHWATSPRAEGATAGQASPTAPVNQRASTSARFYRGTKSVTSMLDERVTDIPSSSIAGQSLFMVPSHRPSSCRFPSVFPALSFCFLPIFFPLIFTPCQQQQQQQWNSILSAHFSQSHYAVSSSLRSVVNQPTNPRQNQRQFRPRLVGHITFPGPKGHQPPPCRLLQELASPARTAGISTSARAMSLSSSGAAM